jgi:hypothetical protein
MTNYANNDPNGHENSCHGLSECQLLLKIKHTPASNKTDDGLLSGEG